MKKMRNGKRGFTLTEIVLVIAIVVILSSVSVVGIAATLSKAQNAQAKLQAENGDNFEVVAWSKVNSIGTGLGGSYDQPEYSPSIEEAKDQLDQAWLDYIEELQEMGYTDDEIMVTYDNEGHIADVQTKEKSGGNSSSGGSGSSSGNTGSNSTGGSDSNTNGNTGSSGNGSSNGSGNSTGDNTTGSNTDSTGGSSNSGSSNSGSGSGSGSTGGFAEASRGTVGYYNGGKPGVMSVENNGSGSANVTFTDGWDNHNPSNDTVTVTVTKDEQAGTYTMTYVSGNPWVITQVIDGYNWSNTYTFTTKDISDIETKTGLKFT